MGEVIHIREILRQREIARSRARDRDALQKAVEIFTRNLTAVADQLVQARGAERPELLERAERLVAMIGYAQRMLGRSGPEPPRLIRRIIPGK